MPWLRYSKLILLILCCLSISACHYYQDYRQKKGTADVTEERAALMKTYRECLKKHENNPTISRERCGAYNDMLKKVDGTGQ